MRILLLALLFWSLNLAAQETNRAPEFLIVRGQTALSNLLAAIDVAYGYPNPATKTHTTVAPIRHPTLTNLFLLPLDLLPIHSPRFARGLELREQVQARLTAPQWEMQLGTNIGVRVFARVTEGAATRLNFFSE